MRIPVYHMEAGNRCFDENVPEETNDASSITSRTSISSTPSMLAVTCWRRASTPVAYSMTGSPMREVLETTAPRSDSSDVCTRLELLSAGTSW